MRRATVHLPADYPMPVTKRGYGFRATCDCGWESRTVKSFRAARAESKAHSSTHTGAQPVSIAGPV